MKAVIARFGVVLLFALAASRGFAGVVVDRLVASVDNVPILQSDWEHAIALEALEQGRSAASFTAGERQAVLERLVDQQLLRAQMGDDSIATAEEREIATQLAKIRADHPEGKTDEEWQQFLKRYGIDETMLRKKVAGQLQVMRFVDLRLRSEARLAREDVEAYYTDTLVPEVRRRGEKAASLAEVYPKIEEILRQQRMDVLLNTWLKELREHSDIQWLAGSDTAESASSAASSGGH